MNNANNQRSAATRFIAPEVLSRIANLELLARGVVEGFVSGLHKSPYKGFSVEFLEYRPYTHGDDPMHIDWKLYLRSDRLFIKQFEDETNTSCRILLDVSQSMAYGGKTVTKFDYARYLAAALAYFVVRQRDGIGISLFDNKLRETIPVKSTRGHLHSILNRLEQLETGEATQLGKPFHELADSFKKRGFIVILSDLLGDPDQLIEGLRHFRFNGNDVILFHIMDAFETNFQFKDIVELEDMETGEKLLLVADEAKHIYEENLNKFRQKIEKECGLLGIDYNLLETDKPLDFALFKYLSRRSARIK